MPVRKASASLPAKPVTILYKFPAPIPRACDLIIRGGALTFSLEYHGSVKCRVKRFIESALFGMLVFPLLLSSSSVAQIGGIAPPTGAVVPPTGAIAPPTGASFAHNGNVPFNSGVTHSTNFPHSAIDSHHMGGGGHRGHHHSGTGSIYYPYYPYAYAAPYADANDDSSDDDDSDYQGGPTVFDRRGSGRDSYIPPSYPGPAHSPQGQPTPDRPPEAASGSQPAAESAPEPPQPPTTLVFKDGHQLEVDNYAIVGQTLYDLTPGHPRKIALADLDLPATQKQNEDHGINFQLPPSSQAS